MASTKSKPNLHTLMRSINKDQEYCALAAFIYRKDFSIIDDKKNANYVCVYHDDKTMYARVHVNQQHYVLKLKQVNDTFQLSGKVDNNLDINDIVFFPTLIASPALARSRINSPSIQIDDIDLISKYEILKSRGCEDLQPEFAKTNALQILKKTFDDYFQPDNMYQILYLYIYLLSNCVMLHYQPLQKIKQVYSINALPPEALLDDIYNFYNLLYVHLTLIQ